MIENSFSSVLKRMLEQSNNGLAIYKGIADAVSGSSESVTVTIVNPDGTEQQIQIPSFGYLANSISRLENTVNTLTNIEDGSSSSIRLSDGSVRKILTSKIPSEAPTITVDNNITNFRFKSNYFFEEMINPLLYVTIKLNSETNNIPVDTQRVVVQRFLLQNIDTDTFNNTFVSGSDINYKSFLGTIASNGYNYILDEEIVDLPPRSKRYTGKFTVESVENEVVNGTQITEYILNTLTYTDNNTGFSNTRYLTINDELEIVSDSIDTKYKVIAIDNSRNAVQLQCTEGFRPINTTTELRISSEKDATINVDIPIGFDEKCVVFIKAIDHDSNIPSSEWSNGVAFYTNNLTYKDSSGQSQTLSTYYQKNVTDIGKMLLSYVQDYYPSIADAEPVAAPELYVSDFNVVQINQQVTDTDLSEEINTLVSRKKEIEGKLDELSTLISTTKTKIQTNTYLNREEKQKDNDILTGYINEQNTYSTEYSNVVNEIQNKYSVYGSHKNPKYRIRGFWKMPEAAVSPVTGPQEIIKFKIRYRYLNNNGSANNIKEYTYVDSASNNTESRAIFSNWILDETILRRRVQNENGVWVWDAIKNADIDSVDINQIEIPISKGEQVEIQIKSVSEAGYPNNPAESEWSDSVIIPFPDNLMYDTINDIVEQNKQDLAKNSLQKELTSMGVKGHVGDSFATNDKYFAHTATSIASGFLSEEQTPITLFDKLQQLENQIKLLQENIEQEMGEINVSLIDADGNITPVQEGTTTYINAGFYKDDIDLLYNTDEEKKGAILNKIYNINISNTKRSGLFLLAKIAGNQYSMVPSTLNLKDEEKQWDGGTDCKLKPAYSLYDNIINSTELGSEYIKSIGKYDLVPINLTNSPVIDFQIMSPNMYQSAQCRGQFIYSRFRDLGDTFNLYASNTNTDTTVNYGTFNKTDLFTFGEVNGYNVNTDFTLNGQKLDHSVFITTGNALTQDGVNEYNRLTASEVNYPVEDDAERNQIIYELLRVPKTYIHTPTGVGESKTNKKIIERIDNINSSSESKQKLIKRIQNLNTDSQKYSIDPRIQTAYCFTDLDFRDNDSSVEGDDCTYLTTHKIGFVDSDKYLRPKESDTNIFNESTCNSYLFLSPVSHKNIQVDGEAVNSKKLIEYGDSNSISVPLVYQSRMTDADGKIFGKYASSEENNADVVNTYFSNIIGIDIWDNKEYPRQYDIIVYSKYKNSDNTKLNKETTSQKLTNAAKDVATNLTTLLNNSVSTYSAKAQSKRSRLK